MKKHRVKNSNKSNPGCMILFALPFASVGVFMTGLTGTTLLGARLEGAYLTGVTFCNTIMPDGEVNSSGC